MIMVKVFLRYYHGTPLTLPLFRTNSCSTVIVQRGFRSANHTSPSANWNVTINIPHTRPPTAEVWVQCFPRKLKHSSGAQDWCIPNKTFENITACVHWWQGTSAAVKWGKWRSSVRWIRLEPSRTLPANTRWSGWKLGLMMSQEKCKLLFSTKDLWRHLNQRCKAPGRQQVYERQEVHPQLGEILCVLDWVLKTTK